MAQHPRHLRHLQAEPVRKRDDSSMQRDNGLDRDLNPGPLAPEARIILLDHRATVELNGFVTNIYRKYIEVPNLYHVSLFL